MNAKDVEELEIRLARSAVLARQIQALALIGGADHADLADLLAAVADALAERLEADVARLERLGVMLACH